MRVCTLASSSSGNSILVFSEQTKILVDIGINLKDVVMKLEALRINPSEINAILLTHEHIDHTKSVGAFMRKYKTKLYVHADGFEAAKKRLGNINENLIIPFYNNNFNINEFNIKSFDLPHDAVKCVGFNIEKDNKKISIATDLGHTTDDIIKNLYNSRLVILESNHDEEMLINNDKYSAPLKARIMGKYGHLSNRASSEIIAQLAQNNVKQVVLAHLSEENNTRQLAYDTVSNYLKSVNIEPGVNIFIDVAPAEKIGTVFHLK